MRLKKRIDKAERKAGLGEKLPPVLFAFSEKDAARQVEQFERDNPGQPYNQIVLCVVERQPWQKEANDEPNDFSTRSVTNAI
jgi:hypothetical protein